MTKHHPVPIPGIWLNIHGILFVVVNMDFIIFRMVESVVNLTRQCAYIWHYRAVTLVTTRSKYVLDSIGWKGSLGTSKTADFNLPAKRSEYTKLDSSKLEKVIGRVIPSWQSGIDRFLKEYRD